VAVLKILPRDILFNRASWALRQLSLDDADDLTVQRWMSRSESITELEIVERELKASGETWHELHAEVVSDEEARSEFESNDE